MAGCAAAAEQGLRSKRYAQVLINKSCHYGEEEGMVGQRPCPTATGMAERSVHDPDVM